MYKADRIVGKMYKELVTHVDVCMNGTKTVVAKTTAILLAQIKA